MRKLERDVTVGIYDCTDVLRIYADKAVLTSHYVRWTGDTGALAIRKKRIDAADTAIIKKYLSGESVLKTGDGETWNGVDAAWLWVQS